MELEFYFQRNRKKCKQWLCFTICLTLLYIVRTIDISLEIDDLYYFYHWFSATEFIFLLVGIAANVCNSFLLYAYMMELERGNVAGEAAYYAVADE